MNVVVREPATAAGARRVQLLLRFRAASHIDYDIMANSQGFRVPWHVRAEGKPLLLPKELSLIGELSKLGRGKGNELLKV